MVANVLVVKVFPHWTHLHSNKRAELSACVHTYVRTSEEACHATVLEYCLQFSTVVCVCMCTANELCSMFQTVHVHANLHCNSQHSCMQHSGQLRNKVDSVATHLKHSLCIGLSLAATNSVAYTRFRHTTHYW